MVIKIPELMTTRFSANGWNILPFPNLRAIIPIIARGGILWLAIRPPGGNSGPDDRNGLRSATLRLGVAVAAADDDGAPAAA